MTHEYPCIKQGFVLISAAHILKLDQYRADKHGCCPGMAQKLIKDSTFFIVSRRSFDYLLTSYKEAVWVKPKQERHNIEIVIITIKLLMFDLWMRTELSNNGMLHVVSTCLGNVLGKLSFPWRRSWNWKSIKVGFFLVC